MNYLNLFSVHDLALLNDWLEEKRELYVDAYWPHSGGSSAGYFIRSMQVLKGVILKQTWHEVAISIFRDIQYPLRGVVNEQFIENVLQQIPDGQDFEMLWPWYYPDSRSFREQGKGHIELRSELNGVTGELVWIGLEPDGLSIEGWIDSHPNEVFSVDVLRKNNFSVHKNQDFYKPYVENPTRFEWLKDLWQE